MSVETSSSTVDRDDLRAKVQSMYTKVAEEPEGKFHFEMGRTLAERLGYPASDLDLIPAEAIASFAGVGYHFGLARIQAGETVVDLGSGSGMDAFLASLLAGEQGQVIGIDMTDSQLRKAEDLRIRRGISRMSFRKGFLEELPVEDGEADVIVSNGVINLCPDKALAYRECARILRRGGRLAISDIVTEVPLTPNIVCDASLWAACIGGAMQKDEYRHVIEEAGFRVEALVENPEYRFLSKSAQGATGKYGVKSVSLSAVKT